MPTLTLSLAPHTRAADAAVRAPRKNLRVFESDTTRLLLAPIVSSGGWDFVTNTFTGRETQTTTPVASIALSGSPKASTFCFNGGAVCARERTDEQRIRI